MRLSDDYTAIALGGGEDYEILFTAPEPVMAVVLPSLGVSATVVGEVMAGEPGTVTVVDERGRPLEVGDGGWDHLDG